MLKVTGLGSPRITELKWLKVKKLPDKGTISYVHKLNIEFIELMNAIQKLNSSRLRKTCRKISLHLFRTAVIVTSKLILIEINDISSFAQFEILIKLNYQKSFWRIKTIIIKNAFLIWNSLLCDFQGSQHNNKQKISKHGIKLLLKNWRWKHNIYLRITRVFLNQTKICYL